MASSPEANMAHANDTAAIERRQPTARRARAARADVDALSRIRAKYVAPTSGTTKTPNKSLLIWLLVVPLALNKQSLILRDPLRRLVGPVVSPHLSKPAGRVIESQY